MKLTEILSNFIKIASRAASPDSSSPRAVPARRRKTPTNTKEDLIATEVKSRVVPTKLYTWADQTRRRRGERERGKNWLTG